MTAALRALAIAIAVAACLDPAVAVQRPVPLRVALLLDEHDPQAVAVRARLQRLVGDQVTFGESGRAASVVVLGEHVDQTIFADGVPVSTVTLASTPNVAIADAPSSIWLRPGHTVDLKVVLD